MTDGLPTLEQALGLPSKYMQRISNLCAMYVSICSPEILDPEPNSFQYDLEDDQKNKAHAPFLIHYGVQETVFGHAMFTIRVKRNLYTSVIIQDMLIIYLVHYAVTNYQGRSMITQLLVWNHKVLAKGLSRKMLLYWLSKFKIIFTNPSQYPEGVDMWKRFIKEHIHNLYFYQKVANSDKIVQLAEGYDESSIWGKVKRRKEYPNSFKQIYIYVSREPL